VVKVLLDVHWLLVLVKTGKDWTWPIVKLCIVYYVCHFYRGINITMTTTTYISIDSRKRASGNTCDAVYFLDRTLQGVQGLKLQAQETLVMQKELVVRSILWWHFLLGAKFGVVTDHQALSWVFGQAEPPSGKLAKWVLKTQPFQPFNVKYWPGQVNNNSDTLSRQPMAKSI